MSATTVYNFINQNLLCYQSFPNSNSFSYKCQKNVTTLSLEILDADKARIQAS